MALIGAGSITHWPIRSSMLISLGTALGPASTSVGHLAAPLAIIYGLAAPNASGKRRLLVTGAALFGVLAYLALCQCGGAPVFSVLQQSTGSGNIFKGLSYALCVPAWILGPSAIGAPASWCADGFSLSLGTLAGSVVLVVLVAVVVWPRAWYNRRLLILGAAMIYLAYALTFTARAGLVAMGICSEAHLIYVFAARYHVLPLIGLATVVAAFLSRWRPILRCDARPGLPWMLGASVGMVMFFAHHHEIESHWARMLRYSDQKATMNALYSLSNVAWEARISRSQLERIITPCLRSWNSWPMTYEPDRSSIIRLIEAPEARAFTWSDDEVRDLLLVRLTPNERLALGSGACAHLRPGHPEAGSSTIAVGRRIDLNEVHELSPGKYRADRNPGSIKFAFHPTARARYLVLPGLKADQEICINSRSTKGRWCAGQSIRWIQSAGSENLAVIDLEGLIHWWGEPIQEISIGLTRPGEICLQGSPRLLR